MALLVLTGAPGSGKTSTGQALSHHFGVEFYDVDQLIVESASLTIPEIFSSLGEEEFRKLEQRAVDEALREFDGIIALGGGAVLSEQTRRALAGQFTVYLTVSPEEALRRIDSQPGQRPLLAGTEPQVRLRQLNDLLAIRVPLYESVANVQVDTTRKTTGLVVAEISAHYAQWKNGPQTHPLPFAEA